MPEVIVELIDVVNRSTVKWRSEACAPTTVPEWQKLDSWRDAPRLLTLAIAAFMNNTFCKAQIF